MPEHIEHEGARFEVDLAPASPGPPWEWPEDDGDTFEIVCENGCPEGAQGIHKFSCKLAGIKYPQVEVHLSTGQDGNVFMILGAVRVAMRDGGVPGDEIEQFSSKLMDTGSYDEALQLVMRTVHVT